jgi:hypothetical protein
MIIEPKKNCKLCSSKGKIIFWDSETQKTFTKGDRGTERPCICLSKQYNKLGIITSPNYEDKEGTLVIIHNETIDNEETDIGG